MVGLTDTARHNRRMPTPSITADATSHLARNVAALRHTRGLTQHDLATLHIKHRQRVSECGPDKVDPRLVILHHRPDGRIAEAIRHFQADALIGLDQGALVSTGSSVDATRTLADAR